MGELRDFVAAASEKLGIPPETLAGLPVVELTGDMAVMIEQHQGICAYSEGEVCVRVSSGMLRITGSGLTIRLMNHRRMILLGKIMAVLLERQEK